MNVKNFKKGFTLTELIIVIVIIGILAGVLIPTFINVVNKANKAADLSLIRNLNEALILDRYDNGEHENMTQALRAAEDFGYEVDKIDAKVSKNKILWDSENDVFCYLTKDGLEYYPQSADEEIDLATESHKLWIITDEDPSTSVYSVYYTGKLSTVEVNDVGFDVGKSNVTEVKYNGDVGNDVVIRTNGGTLTIDDSSTGTIKHYGDSDFLNIIACAVASYHEFGFVRQAQIKKGRVVNEVFEEDEKGIQNLFLIASTSNSFDDIIVGAAEGAKLPDLDRTDVTIPEGGVLVVKVEEGVKAEGDSYSTTNDDYVYLYKSGISEQILTSDTKVGNGTISGSIGGTVTGQAVSDSSEVIFTVGTSQIDNDDSKVAATQIANIPTGEVIDYNSNEIVVEQKATIADVELSQGDDAPYAGGSGTKGNPYLIVNENQWKKLCDMCKNDSTYASTKGKYFKLLSDVDVTKIDSDILNIAYFAGTLDFDNHEVSGLDLTNTSKSYACGIFSLVAYDVTIKNIILTTKALGEYTLCIIGNTDSNYRAVTNILIENACVYGNAVGFTGNNSSPFISYAWANTVTLRNCKNYANMNTAAYVAPFVGSYRSTSPATITFDGCDNYGTIISTGSGASLLVANPTNRGGATLDINFNVNDCHNYGVISSKMDSTLLMPVNTSETLPYCPSSYQRVYLNGVEINKTGSSGSQIIAAINDAAGSSVSGNEVSKLVAGTISTTDNKFVLNETSGASSYALMFSFSAANHNGGGAGYTLHFGTELPSDIMVGSWITKSEAEQTGKGIITHNEYGTTFYTCDGKYVFYEDGATFQHNDRHIYVSFVAYDENGNVLSVATYQY